jgi:hydrocephalus-inducing protein
VTLKPAPSLNYIDFGSVQVYDNLSKNITVSNTGKYNFDYVWETDKMNNGILSLSGGKIRGTLHKGEEMSYKVTFAPQNEINLGDSIITFNVAGKYIYNLVPKGSGVKPALQFSFMQFDFGPCFVTSPGGQTIVEETVLSLVNRDSVNNISIDCGFQKTRALWIDCPPTVLEPGAVLNIPIRFAPRDVKDYTFILPFVVNGTSKIPVTITGSGIQARIELADPSQRRINFGVVNVGDEVRKNVTLINRSKKALPVQLVENDVYSGNAFEERCVLFHPKNEVLIPPKKTLNIALIFSPTKRVSQFSDDLLIRYAGITTKLINISGKAQGIDVALDTDSLPFGNVVQGSMINKTVALENNGDISISFNWLESSLGNNFTIKPMAGKVAPLSQVTFELTFHPAVPEPDIRQNMLLAIPGVSPLSLSCSGACVVQPEGAVQTLNFNSLVRKLESKVIKITNPIDKECYISPSLSGDNWKVPAELKLPAKGAADLTVSYFPVTMTSAENSHQGKLFIALPDGTAQAYQLVGVAGKPECSGDITIETPAKKVGSSSIKLNNWLGESQRFKVDVELTEKPTPATFVIIANVIDVAPYATKEVPIRFNSYVEGNTKGKITFTNTNTGEYCFYNFIGKSVMAEVIETIKIEAPVRQSARYIVGIENPLAISRPDIPIEMGSSSKPDEWWTCDSKYVRLKELTPFTPGSTEATFEIEYRPLLPTKAPTEHLVTIITKNLGIFKYKVVLTAVQSSSLPSLKFNVPLGSTQTETFTFKAYNAAKCDYTCVLKRSDVFSVPKSVAVDAITDWYGNDIKVAITYEPMEVGEVRDIITLAHPEGGEYVCELVATCIAPTPQGPFYVNRGKSVDIPFRNIFASATSFTYSIDSPAFKINSPSATVPPKSQGTCAVTFDPQGDLLHTPGGVIGAKLFIKCATKPDLSWIMYLSGAIGDPSAAVDAAGAGKKK